MKYLAHFRFHLSIESFHDYIFKGDIELKKNTCKTNIQLNQCHCPSQTKTTG